MSYGECSHWPRLTRQYLAAVFAAVWVFLCIFIAPLGPTWAVLGNAGMRLLAVMPYEMMYVYVAELLPTSHRAAGGAPALPPDMMVLRHLIAQHVLACSPQYRCLSMHEQ